MSILDTLTESLVAEHTKHLNEAQKRDLYKAMEELAVLKKHKVFYDMFPSTGELSRDKYPKHMEFLRSGTTHPERLFMAGNRIGKCVSYDTLIDLADGTQEKAGILYEKKKTFFVKSWDGEKAVDAEVVDFIQKPQEQLYRVWLSNGKWFDCAANHRILSCDGYQFVSDTFQSLPCLPVSTVESSLEVQFSDVVHYLKTLQDYQENCSTYHHHDDEQLHLDEDIYQVSVPSQDGAQKQLYPWLHKDGKENICTCNHLQCEYPRSKKDVSQESLGQSLIYQDSIFETSFREQMGNIENMHTFAELSCFLDAFAQMFHDQFQFVSLISPLGHNIDDNKIIAYHPINVSQIYDFFVPRYKNYISQGIVHHNTMLGGYEIVAHATGQYPDWWEGRRFNRPVKIWIGGDTSISVRDIIQEKLLGPPGSFGTGIIPKDCIATTKTKRNIPDAIETIQVRHIHGGMSTIVFKTYEQGRVLWQGTEIDVIWLDEEPPQEIYAEALIRTMTTKGTLLLTFTPLNGMSDVVTSFLDDQKEGDKATKFMVMASWNDAPHLTEEAKRQMLKGIPPNQRKSRSEGVPMIGSGLIYPIDDSMFVPDFELPKFWPKFYGMDVGWNVTAVCFFAWDRQNDCIYVYSEHYGTQSEPVVHADAIKRRGAWMKGVVDPASRGRSQADGKALIDIYRDLGLKISPANNAVEAGIYEVWSRLSEGRLKFFKSCGNLSREIGMYHRDQDGKIVKKNDHLLDALRYGIMSGIDVASCAIAPVKPKATISSLGWT